MHIALRPAVWLTLLASATLAFAAEATTPAAKVELFNGKDTVGWVAFPEAAA